MDKRPKLAAALLLAIGFAVSPLTLGCGGSSHGTGNGSSGTQIVMNPVAGTILPSATVSTVYSQTFIASGGVAPYTFTVVTATPDGLALSSITPNAAALTGTPTVAGTNTLTLQVVDSTLGNVANVSYNLTIK
jgi:hypothetical protein